VLALVLAILAKFKPRGRRLFVLTRNVPCDTWNSG